MLGDKQVYQKDRYNKLTIDRDFLQDHLLWGIEKRIPDKDVERMKAETTKLDPIIRLEKRSIQLSSIESRIGVTRSLRKIPTITSFGEFQPVA